MQRLVNVTIILMQSYPKLFYTMLSKGNDGFGKEWDKVVKRIRSAAQD